MGKTWFDRMRRRRIIVHTYSGNTYEGALWLTDRDGVTLRDASLVEDGGRKTPLAGEVNIPRSEVIFNQHME